MKKHINVKRILKIFFLLIILTFASLLFAASKDEGTYPEESLIWNFLAKTFYFFRFPTHVLFWRYMNGWIFYAGLILNCIFYSIVINLIIEKIKRNNFR